MPIVKFGYVPLVFIPVPAVSDTVWSGAVLVTILPVKSIPVPAVNASCFPLNVLKSVALKYPSFELSACVMLISGLLPPLELNGALAVTSSTIDAGKTGIVGLFNI